MTGRAIPAAPVIIGQMDAPAIIPKKSGGFNAAAHGLRGLAAVFVMLAHIIGGTAEHIYPHVKSYVQWVRYPWNFGTFGVEIFFVISGYVILQSAIKYNLKEFGLRRFVRIYPLFFALSLLFIALNFVTNAYKELNNVETIVSGLLFINLFTGTEQLTPNAWSLSYEACFYVLTALIVTFAYKRRNMLLGALAVMLAIAFLIAFPITVYFLIGVAMRLLAADEKTATPATWGMELVSFVLMVASASQTHLGYTAWDQFGTPAVPMILLSITAYFYFALRPGSLTSRALGGQPFRYFGDVSYSLYLVHPFPYFLMRMIFVKMGWFTGNIPLSMTAFGTAVVSTSLVATHFIYRTLERGPYEAMFHQRIYHDKRRKAAAS